MNRSVAIVLTLCAACFWGGSALSQENGPEWRTYTNPQSTLSWWTRTTNRFPWLRERLGVDYTFDKSIGVVIAISDYKDTSDFPDLASPARDAVRMKDFLIDEAGFDKVYVLVDDDASRRNIRDLMEEEIASSVGPDDRLLVYWSGHGGSAIDSSGHPYGFLALQEATEDGRIDSIHMDATRRWLRRTQARHVLFVFDACYSGLTLQASNPPRHDPGWDHIAAPSEFLLTSSAANQESYGHSDGSGGLFTTAFLEAARGAADTDSDGIATVTEIALYAERRLRDGHLFTQTSQFGAMGRQEGRFFFPSGIEPGPAPTPDTRPVESTGGPCSAANADYQSLVRDSQQCGTVEAFLDQYTHVSECLAYKLAIRRKNEVCGSEPAQPGSVPELVDEQSQTTQTDTLIADIESRLSHSVRKAEDQLVIILQTSEIDFKFSHAYINSDGDTNTGYLERNGADWMLLNGFMYRHDEQACNATYTNWCWDENRKLEVDWKIITDTNSEYSERWVIPLNHFTGCPGALEVVSEIVFEAGSNYEFDRIKNVAPQRVKYCEAQTVIGDCGISVYSADNQVDSESDCISILPAITRVLPEGFSSWSRYFDEQTKRCVFRFSRYASSEADCPALAGQVLDSVVSSGTEKFDSVSSGFILNP